jgi:hypothetical protein
MNRRYRNRVDIAMKVTEKDKALQTGIEINSSSAEQVKN